jgi:hypothetical protein
MIGRKKKKVIEGHAGRVKQVARIYLARYCFYGKLAAEIQKVD